MMRLARDIRKPRAFIGYSAFLCFAMLRECRPCVWQGDNRVDLVEAFAPWAKDRCERQCVVDGVCC